MQKRSFILSVVLLSGLTAFAQRDDGFEVGRIDSKNLLQIGPKFGATITSMGQPDEVSLYDGSGIAFSGGIAFRARFNTATENSDSGTGLLGAGLELKYKMNTVKTIATDESGKENADLSIGYFEVPLFVQIYPFYKTKAMNTFYIEAGPDFAGIISRKPKSLTVDNLPGEYSSVTYHIDDDKSTLKGMDVRVMAGIGYDFPIKNSSNKTASLIGINARYYMGTSNLAGNFNSKMNTLELSLSWMFNISKF